MVQDKRRKKHNKNDAACARRRAVGVSVSCRIGIAHGIALLS